MRNLGIFSLILSICAIVLSAAFLSTVQTVEKNQNSILSRVETLEQNSGEDPGEDPGVKYNTVILQPGESFEISNTNLYLVEFYITQSSIPGMITGSGVGGGDLEDVNLIPDSVMTNLSNDDSAYLFQYFVGDIQYYSYDINMVDEKIYNTAVVFGLDELSKINNPDTNFGALVLRLFYF